MVKASLLIFLQITRFQCVLWAIWSGLKSLLVNGDPDQAGNAVMRQSVNGTTSCRGKNTTKADCLTQEDTCPSSRRSEFEGVIKSESEMSQQCGIGKLRHLAVRYFWVQQHMAQVDIEVFKCRGDLNEAGLLTESQTWLNILKLVTSLGFVSYTANDERIE